jgi:hypothetical protein
MDTIFRRTEGVSDMAVAAPLLWPSHPLVCDHCRQREDGFTLAPSLACACAAHLGRGLGVQRVGLLPRILQHARYDAMATQGARARTSHAGRKE